MPDVRYKGSGESSKNPGAGLKTVNRNEKYLVQSDEGPDTMMDCVSRVKFWRGVLEKLEVVSSSVLPS